MKIILTYGTFDLFHVGHVRLLKRLSELGDKLIVGLSTDEFNAKKSKAAMFSYSERFEILSTCKYVDEIIPESSWEQKIEDIKSHNVDIFAIGDDWQGKFDNLKNFCDVIYLERTHDVSTTQIKKVLSLIDKNKIEHLETSITDILKVVKTLSNEFRN